MLNEIVGLYLADKFGITTDRILFALSVDAGNTQTFTIVDANNGSKLKTDLTTSNYFITKYTIWSQNGILDITIQPDGESTNQLKTLALTKQTESPIIPLKVILADINIIVTNNQTIDDDLFLALEIFKMPQNKMSDLMDIGRIICTSPENIDLQTLGIEKYLIYTNELLKALILANKGQLPADISTYVNGVPETPRLNPEKTKACKR